jgi:hypothetical protein
MVVKPDLIDPVRSPPGRLGGRQRRRSKLIHSSHLTVIQAFGFLDTVNVTHRCRCRYVGSNVVSNTLVPQHVMRSIRHVFSAYEKSYTDSMRLPANSISRPQGEGYVMSKTIRKTRVRKAKPAQTKVIRNAVVTCFDTGKSDKQPNQLKTILTNVVAPDRPIVWVPQDRHLYEYEVAKLKRQQTCSHRKGDSWVVSTPNTGALRRPDDPSQGTRHPMRAVFPLPRFYFDFNVSMHTFPDRHQEIKCMTCKRVWKNGDPDFAEAYKMVQNSTNKPSSSEIVHQSAPPFYRKDDGVVVTFFDKINQLEFENNGNR